MYTDKKKLRIGWLGILLAVVIFAATVYVIYSRATGAAMKKESADAIRETVERSARQCYAVEGIYPPDLDYLTENYGLQINLNDYYVSYEIFASNVAPNVKVVSKR